MNSPVLGASPMMARLVYTGNDTCICHIQLYAMCTSKSHQLYQITGCRNEPVAVNPSDLVSIQVIFVAVEERSLPFQSQLLKLLHGSAVSHPGARLPPFVFCIMNDSPHEAKSKSKLADQIRYACSDWGGGVGNQRRKGEEGGREEIPQRKCWRDLTQEECKMQLN